MLNESLFSTQEVPMENTKNQKYVTTLQKHQKSKKHHQIGYPRYNIGLTHQWSISISNSIKQFRQHFGFFVENNKIFVLSK